MPSFVADLSAGTELDEGNPSALLDGDDSATLSLLASYSTGSSSNHSRSHRLTSLPRTESPSPSSGNDCSGARV